MPKQFLTEEQKRLAEEILRGTPRTEIARKLGVSRTTVYEWMKNPDWQAYFHHLAKEVEVARRQRIMPITMKAAEVMEARLQRELEQLEEGGVEGFDRAAKLTVLVEVLKKLVEMERLEAGEPQKISETKTDAPAAKQKGTRLDRLLDQLLEGPAVHDPSETAVAGVAADRKDH